MSYKPFQFLRDEAKKHSDKALQYFREAAEMYEEIKKLPFDSPDREKAMRKMIELGNMASAEVKKSIEFSEQFIAECKRYENRNEN